MYIKQLKLSGFRNYIQSDIKLAAAKVIIIGKNAQGKTNLLEVVQLLSLGKAKRAKRDAELVHFELDEAVIHADVVGPEDDLELALLVRRSGRRTLKVNQVTRKPSEIAHNIYAVSFMVDDLEIVTGSPSQRRDWIDAIAFQLSKAYKEQQQKYDKVLSQRNSLIKKCVEAGMTAFSLPPAMRDQFKLWNDLFIEEANKIIDLRLELLGHLGPIAQNYYRKISNSAVDLHLNYQGEKLTPESMEENLVKDFARMHTTSGPHRHDIEFRIDDRRAAAFASQGEKRSVTLALKLAELEALKNKYSSSPILLLDDVLAELDEDRQDYLLDAVGEDSQVIVTTTHLGKHIEKWSQNAQILTVDNGMVKSLESEPAF